ncbi:MAG: response regulator [Pyrinomonadaceae bacterium]
MSSLAPENFATRANSTESLRRALLVADASALTMQQQLAASGYQTLTATVERASEIIKEFEPDVIVVEVGDDSDSEPERFALARRLRAEPATYALPLVLVFKIDERSRRNAALNVGADDYFPVSTSAVEMRARLDALFWRVEAGRRAAAVVGDQRLEIDNFMLVLDLMSEEMRAGHNGTLAIIYAIEDAERDRAARQRALAEAYGFLKLNLRRIDAVAFYGPTTLISYMPRTVAAAALKSLSKVREEFLQRHSGSDIVAGLASFPEHGSNVESLIESAETAANHARTDAQAHRVLIFGEQPEQETDEQPVQDEAQTEAAEQATTQAQEQGEEANQQPSQRAESFTQSRSESAVRAKDEPDPADDLFKKAVKERAEADAARAAMEAAARERERRASGVFMPRRLLLTVSNAVRMVQLNTLIRAAGYEARAAFDGQQALDLLRIERPDLLLLDFELNGIDGLETLRRLRKQSGGHLKLPVVMLLASNNERERNEALSLGARDVVTMPYDPAKLLASVRTAGSTE